MNIRIIIAAICTLLIPADAGATAGVSSAREVKLLTNDIQVNPDGTYISTAHAELYADNAAAAMKIGQSSVEYNAAMQTLDIVEAYTLKKDGTKIPVDVSAIYDQLAPGSPQAPMFTDAHVKTVVFPQFETGDTAIYTARIRAIHPYFPGEFWYGDLFPPTAAYDQVRETLTAPSSMVIQVENHGVIFDKHIDGDKTVYSWSFSAPEATHIDLYAVSPASHMPRFFATTFKNYAELGRTYAEGAASAGAVTPAIQSLADGITTGLSDRRAQAQAIYAWVSTHIRYVGIELGIAAYVPHSAATVLTNGYGDCKDHVAILGALLKAKGIDAVPVLVNADSQYVLTDVSTFIGLDHVITYLPQLDVYLDSTAVVAPFGVLPFSEYGKPAVYASGTNARRGTIPILPPGVASATTTTTSRVDANGQLTGTTVTTATGPYAIALREFALAAQVMGQQNFAQKLLSDLGYSGDATGELTGPPPTDLTPEYATTGKFVMPNWKDYLSGQSRFYLPGGMRLLGLSGEGLAGPLDPSALRPDSDVACFSGHESEDISLAVPGTVQFDHVPDDVHVKTDQVRFDAHWSISDNTMHVHRDFMSNFGQALCTADMRKSFASALKQISDSYDVQLALEPIGSEAETKTPLSESSAQTSHPTTAPQGARNNGAQQPWYAADIAGPPKDPKLRAMMEDVLTAIHQRDTTKALALLDEILRQPDLPISVSYPALFDRAEILWSAGEYDAAIEDLTTELAKTPGDERMLFARAIVYTAKADQSDAIADLDTVLAADPNNIAALELRGRCYMELANYQAAVRDYTAELAAGRDYAGIHFLRGAAYERLGRHKEALADIDAATKLGDAKAQADFAAITAPQPSDSIGTSAETAATQTMTSGANIHPPSAANEHAANNYPPLARRLGEVGDTIVSFVILADGSTRAPIILKSSGFTELDKASLMAVKAWRYHPATQNGEPIAVNWQARVTWKLAPYPATSNSAANGGSDSGS